MTSVYGSISTNASLTGRSYEKLMPFIPQKWILNDGSTITIDFLNNEEDVNAVRELLAEAIEGGISWPFEHPLSDEQFRTYFFSHTALVVKNEDGFVMGTFYCKPNFPGRCSHYCNGGFITHPLHRRKGIATCMGKTFLDVARAMKFKAVLFNLVFTQNQASVGLWKKLGFKQLARLPNAGRLKTGWSDALQFYYDLREGKERPIFLKAIRSSSSSIPLICFGGVLFLLGRITCNRS